MLDYICEDNSIIVARNSIRSSGPTHPWGPSGMAAGTSAGAAMSRAHCGSLPGLGEADRRDLGARPHAAIVGDFGRRRRSRGQRHAEAERLTEIAVRLLARFGAETAGGFLFYEILGRPLDRPELLDYAKRLDRTSSIAPFIVEEFLAFASHSNERSSSR
jgi:hypothetical protein